MISHFHVTGGHHHAVDPLGLAQRGQRLPVKHARQGFALFHGQKSCQALLGIMRALHRQDGKDHVIPNSRQATRARAFFSRSPRMMVLVTTGRMSSAATCAACLPSTSSRMKTPQKSAESFATSAADDRSPMLFIIL